MKRLRITTDLIIDQINRVPKVVWAILGVVLGLLLIGFLYTQSWAGFRAYSEGGHYYPTKTLWDWLELLGVVLVPIMIFVFGYALSRQQDRIAEERNREVILQHYLDRMTELLLEKELRTSEPGAEVRVIARARTVTTLRQLDQIRRAILLEFLRQAELINSEHPVQILRKADLRRADLTGAYLREAVLSKARLWRTNLERANLREANLDGTYLSGANLRGANLRGANLRRARLWGTDLSGADLSEAILEGAHYKDDTKWPDEFDPQARGAIREE